jgi:hypothetical protein
VLKLRAQIASFRFAQGSRILIITIGMDRAQRLAAASGTIATPTPSHHLADRVEISQTRPKSQANAEPGGVSYNMDLKRGRTGQSDEVAPGQLLKVDLAAARELSAPRRHQHQPVLAEWKSLDIVGQGMLGRKAEIRSAARNRGGDIGAFMLLDIGVDIGTFAQKRRKRFWQMLGQTRSVGGSNPVATI